MNDDPIPIDINMDADSGWDSSLDNESEENYIEEEKNAI